jgi:acetyl esterase/lipase
MSWRTIVWVLAAALLAVAALAVAAAFAPLQTLSLLQPTGGGERIADIAYGPHARHKLDIFVPTSAPPSSGHPVVVFFYGGSWNRGSRAEYRFVGDALAARGILTVLVDYRLYPEVRWPAFLDDSARAVAWVLREAARHGGDAKRVFVAGHSAGAYNAAMLALDARWLNAHGAAPSALAGWVGLAGPYDFFPMKNPDARPVFFHPNYPKDSQPIDFAGPATPPALLAAAREDTLVDPRRNAVQLAEKLGAAGVPVRLELYDKVSHSTLIGAMAWPLRWMAPVLDDVVAFVGGRRQLSTGTVLTRAAKDQQTPREIAL